MTVNNTSLPNQVLTDRFGFESLLPHQQAPVDRLLGDGDALVVMPTGSGKSLCYQLPALAIAAQRHAHDIPPGVTLVFSPLIALMEDQVSALRKKGVRAQYVNSTVGRKEREERYDKLAQGAYELFYATPERMEKPAFREALNNVPGGVNLLAIDEAHCISKWGHDLRPAYRQVGEFRKQLPTTDDAPVRTVALTATATPEVKRDIRDTLGLSEEQMPLFEVPLDRPNLSLQVQDVWDDADKVKAIGQLASECPGVGIVYFALIKDLERLLPMVKKEVARVTGGEVAVDMYHGELSPGNKRRVYKRFVKAGKGNPNREQDGDGDQKLILCATNAFGMGVDKPDIRFIAHAQVPGSVEAYAQEVGRAGRDGEPSVCRLLYAQDDLAIQQQFAQWKNPSTGMLETLASCFEHSMHADMDAGEARLEALGKGTPPGAAQHAVITLEKLGIIEETSVMGRYRFVRAFRDDDVDEQETQDKLQRDLKRLLNMVELTKASETPGGVAAYVRQYFAG